jgi:hypothetical protein
MGCDVLDMAVPGPAPFKQVIGVRWDNGPTDGVVECGDSAFYIFRLVAWEFARFDRIYVFSPTRREVAEGITAILDGFDPEIHDEDEVLGPLSELLGQAGPIEYLAMVNDMMRTLVRCLPLHDPKLRRQVETRVLERPDQNLNHFVYSLAPHEQWVALLHGRRPQPWW